MTADLTRKARLDQMVRLGDALDGLEKAGREPTTEPAEFEGREGYKQDFLNGWRIELPRPKAGTPRANDMRELKRGGSGVELTYRNFSVIMSASRRMPMLTAANIGGIVGRIAWGGIADLRLAPRQLLGLIGLASGGCAFATAAFGTGSSWSGSARSVRAFPSPVAL